VARMGEERKVYKVLVGKPEGKRPLGRPRRRWEDGNRMDLREIGLGGGCGLDSTGSGQGLMAGCCECGDEPSGSCATELVMIFKQSQNIVSRQVNEMLSLWLASASMAGWGQSRSQSHVSWESFSFPFDYYIPLTINT
jgi:hypothetical protein